jgi:hypothetical protein
MKPPILNDVEAILKVSGIASASLLPEEAKGRVCHRVAIDIAAYYEPLIEQDKADVAGEIFEVYDRYIKLLGEEIDTLSPLAIAHGWRSVRFEAGNKCRADIESLKSKYTGGKKC